MARVEFGSLAQMSSQVQIMRALRAMPPMPDVVSRVLHMVRNPDYSIDPLVAVVRADPCMTARILKLCNSSLFGLTQTISSISDGVANLGSRNIVKVVLLSCTGTYFKDLALNAYADPTELWRQTLACSSACQALAERCGHGQPAMAFTAGILHNIGRIAMIQVVEPAALAAAAEEMTDPTVDPQEVERRIIGLDHSTAAGIVSEAWDMPMELRRAARNHHNTAQLATDDALTALLHVADEIVMELGIGDPCPQREHEPHAYALSKLRLHRHDVREVRNIVAEDVERIARLLDSGTGSSR